MRGIQCLSLLCAVYAGGNLQGSLLGPLTDTHLHITNFSLFQYPWGTQVMQCPCAPPCICDWTISDYNTATSVAPAQKLVFVEVAVAPQFWLAEAQWVQSLIDGGASQIGGIMAQRPPGFGIPNSSIATLDVALASLGKVKDIRGVRAGAIDWANFTAVDAVTPHFQLLQTHGMSTADLIMGVTEGVAKGVARLAGALPGLSFVIDHHGSPPVLGNATAVADWEAGMKILGGVRNVFVKWGGLLQYFYKSGAVPTLEQVSPWANFVLDNFKGKAVFERNWFFW